MSHHTAEHRDPKMNECIDTCTRCHQVCLETIHYCLEEGGRHAEPQHIALLQTCADLCRASADVMLRGSDAFAPVCRACAELCRRCAEMCDAFGDDEDMRRCADHCRRCAESCEAMAA